MILILYAHLGCYNIFSFEAEQPRKKSFLMKAVFMFSLCKYMLHMANNPTSLHNKTCLE